MVDKIRELFDEYSKNEKFSGVSLIKKGEETLFEYASGYAHKGYKIQNKITTMFDVASVTKVFTATAIMMLVNEGKLKLSDKIHDIIDLSNTEIPTDVEVMHLLTHTSGIADDAEEDNGEDYSDLFKNSPNYAIRTEEDFIPNFAYKKPNFKAGTDVRYNNCAFILLGLAIEKITGKGYREFVEEKIFKPFKMENTKFCAMDEVNENIAEGYFKDSDKNGETIWKKNIYSYPPIGTADGGVYTSVYDLDKFIRNIKEMPELSELFSPHCKFTKKYGWDKECLIRYGYAFEFLELKDEIYCMYKDGCNEGVASMFAYYPKVDITFSILANQDCNVWDLHRKVEKILKKL